MWSRTKAADAVAANVDPLVEEYGALFFVARRRFKAIRSRCREVRRIPPNSLRREEFVVREVYRRHRLWDSQTDSEVKVALARFVKQQAEENHACEFIPKRTNAFLGAVLQLLKGFPFEPAEDRQNFVHVGTGC
jgi:hypothetical protein